MAKKIVIQTEVDNKQSVKSLNQLEEELNQLKEDIKEIPDVTSQAFKETAAAISKAEAKVKDLNKSFEGLDADAKAGEMGRLAGGLGAIGTAAALAFGDNEDVEKFFQTFAQGLAVTNAVKGGIEAYSASVKLLRGSMLAQNIATKAAATAQAAYSAVVGTSTGALKLFRLALIGTGIGAIVVGITALIANFEDLVQWVKDAIKKFDFLRLAVEPLIWAFNQIKAALQELGIIASEAEKQLEKSIEALKKQEQSIGDKYDYEIAKAKAAGKQTFELEQAKRRALIERIKAEALAIKELAILQGEVTDEQKERFAELTQQVKKLSQESTIAVITEEKKKNDARKKASDDWKKEQEVEAKRQADLQKAIEDATIAAIEDGTLRQIEKIHLDYQRKRDAIQGETEKDIELKKLLKEEELRQIAAVEEKAEKERQAKRKEKKEKEVSDLEAENELDLLRLENKINSLYDLEDVKEAERLAYIAEKEATQKSVEEEKAAIALEELALKRDNELISQQEYDLRKEAVEIEHKNRVNEIEKESANQRMEFENKLKDAKIAAAMATVGALTSISNSMTELGIENAGLAKTLAIAQIAIDTGVAIAGAIKAGSGVPFPANIPAIATGVSAVLAGIVSAKKALSAAKIPKGGGGGGFNLPSISGGGSASAPQFNQQTLFSTQDLVGAESEEVGSGAGIRQQQVVKAVVVERDITETQERLSTYEQRAEIG